MITVTDAARFFGIPESKIQLMNDGPDTILDPAIAYMEKAIDSEFDLAIEQAQIFDLAATELELDRLELE